VPDAAIKAPRGTVAKPGSGILAPKTDKPKEEPKPEDTPIGIIYGAGLMILVILGGVLHVI